MLACHFGLVLLAFVVLGLVSSVLIVGCVAQR